MSKHGVKLIHQSDGSYRLEFDDTPRGRSYAASGSGDRQQYVMRYDSGHNRHWVPERVLDQYAKIQSYKDQCLIENIIRRCVNGDASALNQVQGFYGDVSGMPTSLPEMYDIMERSKGVFDALSEEQKAAFGGSFPAFLEGFANPETLARAVETLVGAAAQSNPQEVTSDVRE